MNAATFIHAWIATHIQLQLSVNFQSHKIDIMTRTETVITTLQISNLNDSVEIMLQRQCQCINHLKLESSLCRQRRRWQREREIFVYWIKNIQNIGSFLFANRSQIIWLSQAADSFFSFFFEDNYNTCLNVTLKHLCLWWRTWYFG